VSLVKRAKDSGVLRLFEIWEYKCEGDIFSACGNSNIDPNTKPNL